MDGGENGRGQNGRGQVLIFTLFICLEHYEFRFQEPFIMSRVEVMKKGTFSFITKIELFFFVFLQLLLKNITGFAMRMF